MAVQLLSKVRGMLQTGCLIFTIPVLIASGMNSNQAATYKGDRYAPSRYNVPDRISGYAVLAVLNEDNFACARPREKRLLLQSPQQTIEEGLINFPKTSIEQELNTLGLGEYALSFMGPGATREQVMSQLTQAQRFSKLHGCMSHDVPLHPKQMQAGAENKNPAPYPSYTIIQNSDIANYRNNNAQIVNFIAPPVPNQTQFYGQCHFQFSLLFFKCDYGWGYSSLLNNGMTVNSYFLQVGFDFRGGPGGVQGQVVWVATYNDPSKAPQGASVGDFGAKPFSIPYIQGDEYYTTITYTSGVWWTCAADIAAPSTYQCVQHEGAAAGEHLNVDPMATNVFAEDWEPGPLYSSSGNPEASSIQWIVKSAFTLTPGPLDQPPHPWTSPQVYTLDACQTSYPPASAIGGSLINGGTAYFNTSNIPPYCQ